MPELWVSVVAVDGEAEGGFAELVESKDCLRLELPDGTTVLVDPVELDAARRAA